MAPNGSIIAALQGEGQFFRRFLVEIRAFWYFALKSAKKNDENPSLTLQNGDYGPVGVQHRRFAR